MAGPSSLTEMELHEWLDYGMKQGWISRIACSTHDGVPMTREEEEEFEEGYDPCVPVVRLW